MSCEGLLKKTTFLLRIKGFYWHRNQLLKIGIMTTLIPTLNITRDQGNVATVGELIQYAQL